MTIWSVMPVRFVISKGIGLSGLTKVLNLSTISPFTTLTAPISMILSRIELNPVVSMSKTIYVSSSVCSPAFTAISVRSSTT